MWGRTGGRGEDRGLGAGVGGLLTKNGRGTGAVAKIWMVFFVFFFCLFFFFFGGGVPEKKNTEKGGRGKELTIGRR